MSDTDTRFYHIQICADLETAGYLCRRLNDIKGVIGEMVEIQFGFEGEDLTELKQICKRLDVELEEV